MPIMTKGTVMIERIIEFSVRNRIFVTLVTATLIGLGIWSIFTLRLDAIPDLSDVQVIVTTEYPGQNPQVVDDQVTYPLASALLSVPGSKVVRGYSMFEQSFVYVLFEDGTDLYWARSRVLEYLNFARDRLPKGVEPKLGPDATGVGWVYQYALLPGYYSKEFPSGLYKDPENNSWYKTVNDAPVDAQKRLVKIRTFDKAGISPISGSKLVKADLDLSQLRALQDWYLRYPLTSISGVSEVASIGGFIKQYQIVVDPHKLHAFGLSISEIRQAVERSNNDVGGSVLEMSENEYMVRSRGYLKGLEDLGNVPVKLGKNGVPVFLKDVATLQLGGEARRGISEYNGTGEAVGGVIIARFRENAYKVIQDAKKKLSELEEGLPPGVSIKATYDRSELIERSIRTLRHTLIEEIVVVGLVCILFLLHARSELVAVFVVPSSVILALFIMNLIGINANIMSLGGIALSIGVVVDSAIIMVENAHKHLDRDEERVHAGYPPQDRSKIIMEAAKEVGPQLFFSLLIITASFLPVFVLEGEAGRLFKPLAFTKTFAMASASVLSITIIPILMIYFITARVLPIEWGRSKNLKITLSAMFIPAIIGYFVMRGYDVSGKTSFWISFAWAVFAGMLLVPQKIIHENKNPLSNILQNLYDPVFRFSLKNRKLVIGAVLILLISTIFPFSRLGTEFMPPLDEGDLLYMPTTDPSISITKSKEILQQTNKLIASFPEVISVHGKIGRAESATDPAPLSMIETVVQLNPDREQWSKRKIDHFFSNWPRILQWPFLHTFWDEERTITTDELKLGWTDVDGTKHSGLNTVVNLPGMANAWPYPIENRINMLATGIKTPVGIKILGPDLNILGELAEKAASIVKMLPGTTSAYPERTFGGYYLDINVDRLAAARYGVTTGDVQDTIQSAIGGMNITTTVEGLERYPLNIRYFRELRDDIPALKNLLIVTPSGMEVPLGQLAKIEIISGAPMIRSENAQRSAWVFVDIAGRDLGGYIHDARKALHDELKVPPGYSIVFSGQFEFWEKTVPRLIIASIVTLFIIIMLLYLSSGSWFRVTVVMLAIPLSLIGAFWFLYLLNYNLSLAVVIGIIALAGLDAETGMVMLLYLDKSFERAKVEQRMNSERDLWIAVHDGAVKRIRPKAMTVAAAFIGLVPLLWAHGTGADVMRRLAAPMIGGLIISFLMELILYPVIYYVVAKWRHPELNDSYALPKQN